MSFAVRRIGHTSASAFYYACVKQEEEASSEDSN